MVNVPDLPSASGGGQLTQLLAAAADNRAIKPEIRMKNAVAALLALALIPLSLARGQEPAHEPYPPPGYAADWQPAERTDFTLDPTMPMEAEDQRGPHHRGFHLRVSATPSLSRTSSVGAPQPTSFSGFAAGAIGGRRGGGGRRRGRVR